MCPFRVSSIYNLSTNCYDNKEMIFGSTDQKEHENFLVSRYFLEFICIFNLSKDMQKDHMAKKFLP